ncbi:cobalt-precorrin-5B (C(1))-methyltransferase [Acidiplasma cupricumulans]|uniref:cobalt-precorrin-5B (C(1))-methyltransferase n=1 Tax=Acidiplasma cupricumulans TaxID=312540 RepID=UPI0007852D01|nr:cobalt-precorrin-5B (C(1))-methyltransferase [Acidiplasma cupricumulans]
MYIEDIPEGNLRYGYTTGACATAATKAALIGLITGNIPDEVTIELPVKKNAVFKISHKRLENDYAEASVLKDGGDDPDVTTGLFYIFKGLYVTRERYKDPWWKGYRGCHAGGSSGKAREFRH